MLSPRVTPIPRPTVPTTRDTFIATMPMTPAQVHASKRCESLR